MKNRGDRYVQVHMEQNKKDLDFLESMQKRFEAFRTGGSTQGDYVVQMMQDWLAELKGADGLKAVSGNRGE